MLRASSDGPVFLISVPKLGSGVQFVTFGLQLQFFVPALLSYIAPSRSGQFWLPRRFVARLYFSIVVPAFCVFDRSAWLVSSVSGKSQYSIMLLAIENA